jgi:hypothetical protein
VGADLSKLPPCERSGNYFFSRNHLGPAIFRFATMSEKLKADCWFASKGVGESGGILMEGDGIRAFATASLALVALRQAMGVTR